MSFRIFRIFHFRDKVDVLPIEPSARDGARACRCPPKDAAVESPRPTNPSSLAHSPHFNPLSPRLSVTGHGRRYLLGESYGV